MPYEWSVGMRCGRGTTGTTAWGARSKIEPVMSRAHQLKVVEYIRAHAEEGVAVWSVVGLRDLE